MRRATPSLTALPCLCASFRRAARALTQRYEQALRPFGLKPTQFTLLQALALSGEVSQGQLGELLVLDSTTLTRTLGILARRGWLAHRRGRDRRQRHLRLTPAGRRQLRRALPAWQQLQEQLRRPLGQERWDSMLALANRVTTVATKGA